MLRQPTVLIEQWNNKRLLKKKKKMTQSWDMFKTNNRENLNIKWKKRESKKKKKEKFKSWEICKKKQQIDKERLMLSELRELMKHKRDKLGILKCSIWRREQDFLLISKWLEKNNSMKKNLNSLLQLNLKNLSSLKLSKIKEWLNLEKEEYLIKSKTPTLITRMILHCKLAITLIKRSSLDSISLRKAEKSELPKLMKFWNSRQLSRIRLCKCKE